MKLTTVVSKYILLQRSSGMRFITTAQVLEFYCRAMGDIDVSAVNPQTVSRFLLGKGRLTRTWHQKHGILKSFYRFAIGRGYATASPLPTITPQFTSAFTPYIYSIDELRRIMAAILAARKLAQYDGGKRVPATVAAISDAVRWAEEIMRAIDDRFPRERSGAA